MTLASTISLSPRSASADVSKSSSFVYIKDQTKLWFKSEAEVREKVKGGDCSSLLRLGGEVRYMENKKFFVCLYNRFDEVVG